MVESGISLVYVELVMKARCVTKIAAEVIGKTAHILIFLNHATFNVNGNAFRLELASWSVRAMSGRLGGGTK